MASSIFDILDHIFVNKTEWEDLTEDEKKAVNPYMINRFISMNPQYIEIVNYLQSKNLEPKVIYKAYKDWLPKGKEYFKYVKPTNSFKKEILDAISKYFECSVREAKEYALLLKEEDKNNIIKQINGK
jgi:hypothetical protein